MRCDELKPICKRCDRSTTECVWTRDIKIVFHENSDKAPRRPTLTEKTSPALEVPSNAPGTGLLTPCADTTLPDVVVDMATAEITGPGSVATDIVTPIEGPVTNATSPDLPILDIWAADNIATADIANIQSTVTSPAPHPELFAD